jgi:hypothetical protein
VPPFKTALPVEWLHPSGKQPCSGPEILLLLWLFL